MRVVLTKKVDRKSQENGRLVVGMNLHIVTTRSLMGRIGGLLQNVIKLVPGTARDVDVDDDNSVRCFADEVS